MNEKNQTNDLHSLSHTKWNYKYHVVFTLKYCRMVFYGNISMQRSCAYVGRNTAENKCIRIYWIFKRKEQLDDIYV